MIPDILASLVACLSGFETVDPAAVKAYHSLRTVWAMGEGAPEGFVQCQVSILTGRPAELQAAISAGIMAVLEKAFEVSVEDRQASITVEIREMTKESFRKVVKKSL